MKPQQSLDPSSQGGTESSLDRQSANRLGTGQSPPQDHQGGGQDRARWLQGLHRWFQPQDVVQMAYRAEQLLPPELRS